MADIILILLSVFLAFIVRFEGSVPSRYFLNIFGLIISAIIFTLPIFYFLKLYSFSWAYVSTEELISLIKATTLSFLLLTASFFILRDHSVFSGFPRSTLFMTFFFIFIFCGGIRFAKRIYLQRFQGGQKKERERTLIVGAGGAGEQVLRNILNSRHSQYLPIGFIDDSPARGGLIIHGLKVLGKIDDIPQIAKEYNIDSLIIAFPSAGSEMIKKAEKKGIEGDIINIKYLPPMDELIDNTAKVGMEVLRDVDIDDLLGREPVVLDQKPIEDFLQNKKVLITGAAGSIGSELCRRVAKFKPSLLLILDQDETGIFNISAELKESFPKLEVISLIADIRDEEKIKQIFKKFLPHIVFHAAAYKHVPLMEENVDEAVKNNIFGTKIVAEVAINNKVESFIFISTDKAVNPTSVMGATKRVGEMICRILNEKNQTKFICVRFGNVLNSRGSAIPIFKEQISKGGPVEITHKDMKRYFMVTSEACLLVTQAGAIGQGGEVFVLDMGSPIRIIDLAKGLIRHSGFEPEQDIEIKYIGPRAGEKLFEEILTAEEGTIVTQNQKIFMVRLSNIDEDKFNIALKKLKESVYNKENIIKILKEIIPTFRPTNY